VQSVSVGVLLKRLLYLYGLAEAGRLGGGAPAYVAYVFRAFGQRGYLVHFARANQFAKVLPVTGVRLIELVLADDSFL